MCIYIQYTDTYTYKREFVNMSKFTTPERIFFYPIILIFALDIKRKYAIISLTKQQIYKYILLPNEFRYYFCSTNFTNATLFKRSTLNFFESMACFFFLSSSSINEMYSQFFQFLFVNKSKMNTRENIQNESIQINEKKRKKLKKKFFKRKVM